MTRARAGAERNTKSATALRLNGEIPPTNPSLPQAFLQERIVRGAAK
jgi:hypothetical protein